MRNNSVKYIEFGSVVREDMLFKKILSVALVAFLFSGAEPFMQF